MDVNWIDSEPVTTQAQFRKKRLLQRVESCPTQDPSLIVGHPPTEQHPDAGWYQATPVVYGPKRLWGIAIYDWKNSNFVAMGDRVVVFRWRDQKKAIAWCRDAVRAATE